MIKRRFRKWITRDQKGSTTFDSSQGGLARAEVGRHTKEAYANSFSTLGQLYLQMGRLRDGVDLLRQGLTKE